MTSIELSAVIDNAKHSARPEVAKRIDRGLALVQRHLANPAAGLIRARWTADGMLVWTVKGTPTKRNPTPTYTVTFTSCTCPDATDPRRPRACKHIDAVRSIGRLLGLLARPVAAPAASPAPAKPKHKLGPWVEEIDR